MTLNAEWTVYLVDDDDDDALFFEMAVKQTHSNCIVRRCANGENFMFELHKNRQVATSLVFLDLTMPSLSGIEILRQVRAVPFSSNLPVVILSGSQSPSAIGQAYKAGVTGYLSKPAFHGDWTFVLDRAIHFAKKISIQS
ncbi:response regulator [Dyadobacter psychrotolerans]|nr:response regulator [Dyadobacter psychrotolerans]